MALTTNPRSKFWVWQIATFLYFARLEHITTVEDKVVTVNIPSLGRHLNLKSDRINNYLRELLDMGIIEKLRIYKGVAVIRLIDPPNLKYTVDNDE